MKDVKMEGGENLEQEEQIYNKIKPVTDIADSVATIIVDKIISDAVINSKINDVYKTMNDHCFNFLTNLINPYLKNPFIFYENGNEDLNNIKNKLYFCRKPLEKVNTWTVLPEPKCNPVDRCANTKTKLIKFKKYTDLKDNRLKESEEDMRHLKNNNDENKDISNNNENKGKKENRYKIINSQKNIPKIDNKEKIKVKEKEVKKKIIKQSYKYNEDNSPKKKEKEEILEISTVNDLPIESYENKYSMINSNEENEKLRRERELEMQRKEELKIVEKERAEKRNLQSMMKKMQREFDSNRLTFDPNGKVINLKFQNYDNLEGGFVFSKLRIKTEKSNRKSALNLKDIIYPIEGVDPNQQGEKNESIANTRRSTIKTKGNNLLNRIESDLSKIKIEKNDEEKIWNNSKNKYNNKDKKDMVLPSGGNFDKIIPEVGVIVTGENSREVKEGGFDYVKKYNKPSFNELSRFISESINLNSHIYSSSLMASSDLNKNSRNNINNNENNERKDENNYIGYKEEFTDNNPLIQDAHYLNNNLRHFSPNSNRFNNLSINNSNSKRRNLFKSYDRIKTENNQFQSIQLSKNFESNNQSLKNIFDEAIINNLNNKYIKTNDIDNTDNMNYLEKAVLPFKNLRYKKQNGIRKLIGINEENNKDKYIPGEAFMNKFNSQIINNKEWGKDEDDVYKLQERLNKEMNIDKESIFRKQRSNNRMKNLGMQIMTEGNKIRQRKVPLFGGFLNK